jgi:hypothetical protein
MKFKEKNSNFFFENDWLALKNERKIVLIENEECYIHKQLF